MALLTVRNLKKVYEKNTAVDSVSFQFEPGKCIALIGPNGAGKTTILRILAGLVKPSKGEISFAGNEKEEDIRAFIGYLPQYPVFHGWMTGKEFLVHSGQLAYLSKAEASKRAEQLLKKVGIADAKNQHIRKYSGGMKQRLGIAQAIIHRPRLLMLDEPVSSLDPIGRRDVLTLLEELKQEMTILFSTHILSDASEVSDELLLLNKGKIIEAGSIDNVRQKYQTSKMELTFTNNMKVYQEKINALSAIEDSYIERNILHVHSQDIEEARKQILALSSQHNWPLTSFSINQVTLEEMFMKAVKQ
ncbi:MULTISPECIES: ABC transporter ATP-binding protein [unclassified Virgibacillus]|uniref:ABC transporter ATP-binding protein n=1 Tax=unclassified Virgibacillus TaxID=2620237 RepID=UPI0024DE5D98|nr:ABC transporter ATP-binding protein [Virgibacillus sp. LDC-1]